MFYTIIANVIISADIITKTMTRNLWNKLIFDLDYRKTPRILLGIVLVLTSVCTIYIYKNSDAFISLPTTESILNLENVSADVLTAANPNSTSEDKKNAIESHKNSSNTSVSDQASSGSSSAGSNGSSVDNNSAPAAEESASAFVAFYSDNQSDTDGEDVVHLSVVNKILGTGANPIIHAGDLMEDGTADSLNRYNNIAATLLATRTFYGALGNNDRNGGDISTPSPLYLANFAFPNNEQWYSVNSGNLHIIILDSAFSSTNPSQLAWLASDLQSAASQSRITVVVYHHPIFSSSIESYLQNYGVDFVVAGHIHTYSKTISNGISYFTLPGGASLGFATATVYSTYAQMRTYNTSGNLIESVKITNR